MSTLAITKGDVRQATITIVNPDGTAANLTGKRVIFTAKADRNLSAFVFQKSSATGGIVIAAPTTGVATMTIQAADTASLPIRTVLDCVATVDDNPANPVTVYKGTLTIDWGTS